MEIFDLFITNGVHIFFNQFWITLDNRAVVMIRCLFIFDLFVNDTWIENGFYFFINKSLNMTVYHFSRVTNGITWNGFDSLLIKFFIRFW